MLTYWQNTHSKPVVRSLRVAKFNMLQFLHLFHLRHCNEAEQSLELCMNNSGQ